MSSVPVPHPMSQITSPGSGASCGRRRRSDALERRQALPEVERGDETVADLLVPLDLSERRPPHPVAWLEGEHVDGLVEALQGSARPRWTKRASDCEPASVWTSAVVQDSFGPASAQSRAASTTGVPNQSP